MLTFLRLTSVHPILVHTTIGVIPVLLLAYVVAATRRDDRWAFAADVMLVATAAITLATATFGLVSNAVLEWPGGLSTWRWLHLGFGAFSTVLLVAFAGLRIVVRRRGKPAAGFETVATAALIGIMVGFTGWIGGEVLVHHSGMAVMAAGEGALAPPLSSKPPRPNDVPRSMHIVRASWASANATVAAMLLEPPEPAAFQKIERDASRIAAASAWMREIGAQKLQHGDAQLEVEGEVVTRAQAFGAMAHQLEVNAGDLGQAARNQDVAATTKAVGVVATTCAGCHSRLRRHGPPPAEAALQ